MEDIVREPVVLIDEDLEIVAGGRHHHKPSISVSDVNIAAVDQDISQVQIGGFNNDQAAAQVSSVSQSS
ncbi:MAG: hypothetical protein JOZ17_09060 [Acetobacteraceae bacterium]|nr:hypothetical protein [Acetobacteraceae bacterium]